MAPGDIAAWAGVILSVFAGVAAVVVFYTSERRERRRALTDLHDSLTSGETAAARNAIGGLLYGPSRDHGADRETLIAAYFALIWSLQRARNVFRTYRLPWRTLEFPPTKRGAGVQDVTSALTWNLSEIAENVVLFHDRYKETWSVEDDDAWADIGMFVDAEGLRGQHAARTKP